MSILNLDPFIPIIAPLYLKIGKPARMQVDILRLCVLINDLKIPFDKWVDKLSHNSVLRTIAGFTHANMPKISSYYDFINRVMPLDELPIIKPFISKPKMKLKKFGKLPLKNPGVTDILVDRLINDEQRFLSRLSRQPERFLQKIFVMVSVDQSSTHSKKRIMFFITVVTVNIYLDVQLKFLVNRNSFVLFFGFYNF